LALLDPNRIRHSGNGTGALHNRGFDLPPITSVWNSKHKYPRRGALLIMLDDSPLDFLFDLPTAR
jgi:hypothetical protein